MRKPLLVRLSPTLQNKTNSSDKNQFFIYPNEETAESTQSTKSATAVVATAKASCSPSPWLAKENHIQYELRADSGQSLGLFLNQRLQRHWILNNSKDKSVLTLFSHTGGYSLCAALGKAEQVTSVDSNKNVLNWSKKNFELNELSPEKFVFLCRDSISYIEQCRNRNLKYDLIICDAPSFLRREKGFFKIETDLEAFLKKCIECLNPNGELLFSTNFDGFFINDIQRIILKIKVDLKISNLEINCILPSLDFELPDEKANLKSFLIRRKD